MVIDGGSLTTNGYLSAQNGGTFTLTNGSYTNGLELLVGYAGDGTANFNGGTATLNQIRVGSGTGRNGIVNVKGSVVSLNYVNTGGAGSVSTINFNGGTFKALVDKPAFISTYATGSLTLNVQAGGAIFDSNGKNIGISADLVHDSALGLTPDGGLTKKGSGTLTLSGANTYTGGTTVSTGTLVAGGSAAFGSVNGTLTSNGGTTDLNGNNIGV